MTPKLEKRLDGIRRFGMHPKVFPAPAGAYTFDRMVVVYLDEALRRMYQVFFYNIQDDTIQKAA